MVTSGLPVVYMLNINMINNNKNRLFLLGRKRVSAKKRKIIKINYLKINSLSQIIILVILNVSKTCFLSIYL